MTREEFDRVLDLADTDDVIVFELHSGFRVVVFDRYALQRNDGLLSYTEEDGEESYFDPSTVSRVIRRIQPPLRDRLRPSTNGKH